MNLESTSLDLTQVIDWRFGGKQDTIWIEMDIKAGHRFHLLLADFGMEIYVTDTEMMTLNHVRKQILYENASPDALLKQLFVGGDLNDARFKGERVLNDSLRQLKFKFSDDFSDWESLQVTLDAKDILKQLTLIDYDGNRYLISLHYLAQFRGFKIPDIKQDYLLYQIADLRD